MRLSVFLLFVTLPSLLSCHSRTFGNPATTSRGLESGAVVGPSSAKELLVDSDEFLRGEPPSGHFAEHVVFLNDQSDTDLAKTIKAEDGEVLAFPSEGFYSLLDKLGRTPMKWFEAGSPFPADVLSLSTPFDVSAVEKILSTPPLRFGAKTVLEVMRANRDPFAAVGVGGVVIANPPVFGRRAELEGMTKSQITTNGDSLWIIGDPSRPFSTTRCKNHVRGSFSDLRFHYTCQIPAVFRGCYRIIVGKHFDLVTQSLLDDLRAGRITEGLLGQKFKAIARDDLTHAIAYCRSDGKQESIPAPTLEVYDRSLKSDKLLPVMRIAFQVFHDNQVRELGGGIKVNIFDYIMSSGPFDFDYAQQQAVLNAFYGDLKPEKDAAGVLQPFNPSNEKDCARFRENRPQIDSKRGDHCLVGTPKESALFSNGR